jgi:capsular exopolysaccharide synthesis family protein
MSALDRLGRRPGRRKGSRRGPLDVLSLRDEAFRILRSNVLVALSDLANPVVVVTSTQAGEGKTSTCAMLARSLAESGKRVVLVDVDLRKPDAHRLMQAHNEVGVVDVLTRRADLGDSLQFISVGEGRGLYFLAAGSRAENPTELLGASHTADLLNLLALQADVVLLDTPPVLPVADTLVIGRLAAGAILVVEAGRTPVPAVLQTKAALTRNQTRLLGMVLNRCESRDSLLGYGYDYRDVLDRSTATSASDDRPEGAR